MVVTGDLGNADNIRSMLDQVLACFGRVDTLIHCAAAWQGCRLEETTEEHLEGLWRANTLSAFCLGQIIGLQMCGQSKGGSIVLIGDVLVSYPYLDYAAYFASKAPLPELTRVLALELGRRNRQVRLNAILPGPVVMDSDQDDSERPADPHATLLDHAVEAEDVVAAIDLLVRNPALTGICIPIESGRTLL